MRMYENTKQLQLRLIEEVKEWNTKPAKRVNIVSLKMVRKSSMLYKERKITSPVDAYNLLKP
ncbi:hypothetical protein [Alkalihalobacterium elongatum]|uniref:hypothetical protein n=1 Tax=Alkalihalobacterium elongatum TaxID=2675466 RepID=UPI001C1F6FC6|nr:hypothetical protein [Alkalihalobacterium elongatum]